MLVGYGKKTFNDIYLLFANDEEFDKYLKGQNKPKLKIFAKDYINYNQSSLETQDGANYRIHNLTIITQANISNFKTNEILYDVKNKCLWRIDDNGIEVADDNQMKEYSSRPRALTKIRLVR